MNSGAEAVETSIKASRKWGYDVKGIPYPEAEIIVAEGNFHGRTTTIVGFSTDPDSTSRFGPFSPGFRIVKYGDVEAVRAAITPRTCAVLVEPIQGEGGRHHPAEGLPEGPARDLRPEPRPADPRRDPVRPRPHREDVRLRARGHPARRRHDRQGPLRRLLPRLGLPREGRGHGRLHPRHPRLDLRRATRSPARSGIASLDVLVEEKLIEHAAELGVHLDARLKAIRSPLVKETRCLGLWAGVELVPEAGGARKYCYALKDRGLLCKDTHVNTIRLAPPLVITREQLDWAVDQIEAVLAG